MLALAVSLLLVQADGEIAIPAIGRPNRDFYNAAGERVVVLATADRTALTEGDWLTYTLRISGLANAPSVERPKLENLDGFRGVFQIEQLPEVLQEDKDRRVFAYRLRPRDTGIREVPPFAFRYYDPRDENPQTAFRLALAKAILLSVASAPVDASETTAEAVFERWRGRGDPWDDPAYLIPLVLLPFALLLFRKRIGSSDAAARRTIGALRRISRQPMAEQAVAARDVLRDYLRDHLPIADRMKTADELATGMDAVGAEAVRRYLADCEAILYGQAVPSPNWTGRFREIAACVEGLPR